MSQQRSRCSVEYCRRFVTTRERAEAITPTSGRITNRRPLNLCFRHHMLRYGSRHVSPVTEPINTYQCCMYTSPQIDRYSMTQTVSPSGEVETTITRTRLNPTQVRRQQTRCAELVLQRHDQDIESAVMGIEPNQTILPPLCPRHKTLIQNITETEDDAGLANITNRILEMCKTFHCRLSEASIRGILPLVRSALDDNSQNSESDSNISDSSSSSNSDSEGSGSTS